MFAELLIDTISPSLSLKEEGELKGPARAGGKAEDFAKMGYDTGNADVLERGLVSVVRNHPPFEERVASQSATYRIKGYISTPEDWHRHIEPFGKSVPAT